MSNEQDHSLSEIASAGNLADLEAIRVKTLGKSGTITTKLLYFYPD